MAQAPSIYDKLLELPLFQGHSREDLTSILAKIKVDFRSFKKGQAVAFQDDPCSHIIFLMDGEVSCSRTSLHKDLLFVEHFAAPRSFGSETLFGLRQSYSHTLTALCDIQTLVVDKYSIVNYLFSYEVFRYNMLNKLTTRIQRATQLLWTPDEEDELQRFVLLCKRNFTHPAGYKQIKGNMQSLARMMNIPRAHVSGMLNSLQEKGLVELSRKNIIIPRMERMIMDLQ